MGRYAVMFVIVALMGSAIAQGTKPTDKPAAKTPAASQQTSQAAAPAGGVPYTVQDGDKVDPKTLDGWKTWRALACERCHGAEQEGLVGPALVESLKKLTKEEFHTTIMNGRPDKGMPNFNGSTMVTQNWEGLYAYLKGRSDGKIKPGHLYPIGS
jgi:mono/diheme cytochrome c family protein